MPFLISEQSVDNNKYSVLNQGIFITEESFVSRQRALRTFAAAEPPSHLLPLFVVFRRCAFLRVRFKMNNVSLVKFYTVLI